MWFDKKGKAITENREIAYLKEHVYFVKALTWHDVNFVRFIGDLSGWQSVMTVTAPGVYRRIGDRFVKVK
jgi:hypothetical protein